MRQRVFLCAVLAHELKACVPALGISRVLGSEDLFSKRVQAYLFELFCREVELLIETAPGALYF